jgi:hypothetical protein
VNGEYECPYVEPDELQKSSMNVCSASILLCTPLQIHFEIGPLVN